MAVSPSILLVEDDEDDYVLARDKLTATFGSDLRLDWVSTWDEGLAAISDAGHDVYLVDLRLGARNGLELVREAAARDCTKPIILLTGEDSPDIDLEAMEAGATDYLVKGQITADQLARSIRYGINQKRVDVELRESEERFRAVVNNSPTKIHIKDTEGRYLLVNSEAEKLFGVTDEQARGKTTHEIFPKERADAFEGHDQAVLETGQTIVQEEEWLREGDVHTYLTVKFPIQDFHGKIVAVGAIGTDITERKRTEKALQNSEERFQDFAKIGSDWLWEMDTDLRFSYFSDHLHKVTGLPREHYLGKTRMEVGHGNLNDERWYQHLADLEAHRPFRDFCYTHAHVDGKQYHFSITGMPIFDANGEFVGYRGVGSDITERKRAEEALRASEKRLAGILNITPEAVIVIDSNQRIQLFNEGAAAIFGYSFDEVLEQPVDVLLPSRFREDHHKHIENFAKNSEVSRLMNRRSELVGLHKDGTEIPVAASISKLELRKETTFTVILHDISDRKYAEEAMAIAMDEVMLASRAKSEFLANMSHELRTPLNAIIGFSEIITCELLGPVGSSKYRDYASDIMDSGQHLLDLINDILDVSKIESGRDELQEQDIELPEVIKSVLTVVKGRAEDGGVDLELASLDELPALRADKRKLKQILINILSNAIKFTDAGGKITLRVWCRPDSGHVFQIIDTGIGIELDDIPKALAPFQQVDSDLNRKYEGTGLGLPLTKALVEQHGGSLDLQSQAGIGTTVTVRFPAERIVQSACGTQSLDKVDREAS